MRKNCSSDRENILKFEAEGREFAITRSTCLNCEGSEQFLVTECFLTCSWRFLRENELEHVVNKSNSNWKKILGFRNMQEKLENEFL